MRRIPDTPELVVRPTLARPLGIALLTMGCVAAYLVFVGSSLIWRLYEQRPLDGDEFATDFLLTLFFVPCWIFAWYIWRRAFRGPMLAADATGLWLRQRPLATEAYYVPWSAVRNVVVLRFSLYIQTDRGVARVPMTAMSISRTDLLTALARLSGHEAFRLCEQ